jgi:hypothetical protein
MQSTNCSTLATLQRDFAGVLAFVESHMSVQDGFDGRMERESAVIFCVIQAVAQINKGTFTRYACLSNGTNQLFSLQNVIGATNSPLGYSHDVFHVQSN